MLLVSAKKNLALLPSGVDPCLDTVPSPRLQLQTFIPITNLYIRNLCSLMLKILIQRELALRTKWPVKTARIQAITFNLILNPKTWP